MNSVPQSSNLINNQQILEVIEENIPEQLKQFNHWLCWKYEPDKKGKMTKVPYQTNGEPASTTDPATWNEFNKVMDAYNKGYKYSGIGFVFTENNPFVGADIDHCREPKTGEINPGAMADIKTLNTYTEISPSGTGIHSYSIGKLPPKDRKNGNFEVYDTGRFLTITGNKLEGAPATIEERQAEIEDFHKRHIARPQKPKQAQLPGVKSTLINMDDAELLDRARKAKNGASFDRLFNGDWTGYPSQSEADLAFCNLLAFWTGCNHDQMERIFRQSGLYREKDDKHPTYLKDTIQKAIDGCSSVYGEHPSVEQDFGELNWDGSISKVNKQPQIIVNNRFLQDLTREAVEALAASNYPEKLFTSSGEIVKVAQIQEKDKYGQSYNRPVRKPVTEAALRGYLARSAQFFKAREKNGETDYLPSIPPLELVRDIMAQDDLPLPLLCRIVQAPVMRWDGSMFITPGYDAGSSVYYAPENGFTLPSIPDKPTWLDIKKSINLLTDVVIDFPFDSEASKANFLAEIFTTVLRDLISGPVPLLLIDKPLQGTGASLLSDVISLIDTGHNAHMTTAPEGRSKEEEWRKRITATLIDARPICVIDNLEATFHSPTLCALLTSTHWSDRVLGRSENVDLPHNTCWIGTGNNIRLAGDLPRRCFKVRLDANLAKPWQRKPEDFKHPHLLKYVQENRGALLAAVYTITRAWIIAGRPAPKNAPAMGSFEDWREVIGGILEFSGVPGFLQNNEEIYENAEVNEGIEELIEMWHQEFGERLITGKQLKTAIDLNQAWLDVLPDWLDPWDRGFTRKLGRVLARKAGAYFTNGFKLEKCGVSHQSQLWKVCRVG